MRSYISGLPAQGGSLISSDIRNNFQALNERTDKLTAQATIPPSTTIQIGGGLVYFANKVAVNVPATKLDLGDPTTGVSSFSSSNIGYFKDIVVVARLATLTSTSPDFTQPFSATISYVEGPEKLSSTPEPHLVSISATDVPIVSFIVRQNGLVSTTPQKGQINPINQSSLTDYRNFIDVGGTTYFTTSVGNRTVQLDGYGSPTYDNSGLPIFDGYSTGEFADLQEAIDFAALCGGGTVFLKKGTYTGNFKLKSNVSLIGEGTSSIIKGSVSIGEASVPSTAYAQILHVNIINSTTSPITLTQASYCTIQNCILDCVSRQVEGITFTNSKSNNCTHNFIHNTITPVKFTTPTVNANYNIVALNQCISYTSGLPSSSDSNIIVNNIQRQSL